MFPMCRPVKRWARYCYSGLQYTLAPRLVTNQNVNPAPEWVIGDFSKPLDVVQFGKAHGLTLVRDFGNGAVLYRAESQG